jgi:hypothetical protein
VGGAGGLANSQLINPMGALYPECANSASDASLDFTLIEKVSGHRL